MSVFCLQLVLLPLIGTNIAASKSLYVEFYVTFLCSVLQIIEVSRCFVVLVDTVSVAFNAFIPVFSDKGCNGVHQTGHTHSYFKVALR